MKSHKPDITLFILLWIAGCIISFLGGVVWQQYHEVKGQGAIEAVEIP